VAAAFGSLTGFIAHIIGAPSGVIVTALAAGVFAAAIYGLSRRNPINSRNVNAPLPEGAGSALEVAS
jgi:hypothetical protein